MHTRPAPGRLLDLPETRSARAALHDLHTALIDGDEAPATPLFLHGPPGSGKTALVNALVEELASAIVPPSVCVLASADFPLPPTDFTVVDPAPAERLKAARQCDLLVIEDVQHLPARAHETLVQLVDARLRRRAALIVTAGMGPRHLAHRGTPLPTRLTTRLASGLVVGLEPWQTPSRRRFLAENARQRGLTLDEALLDWLAEHLTGGGRPLDGALHQLASLQRLHKKPLDPTAVRAHFQEQVEAKTPTLERIVEHVGAFYRVTPRQLRGETRSKNVVLPRQVGMYLARQLTPLSFAQIGDHFGGRDHTTVLHACKKVEAALPTDAALAGVVRQMHAELA